MSDTSPKSSDSPARGPSPHGEEPVSAPPSGPPSRIWGLTKLLVVFAVGIGVGYSLAAGRSGPRVIYSGAMTEMEGRSVHGPDDAPVTIVEYTDYECSFCRRYNRLILPEILDKYEGRIRYIVRHFPLVGLHPAAVGAAVAAVCAERQGSFWEYHDLLFAQEKGLSPESLVAYAQETGLQEEAFQECLQDEETSKVVQEDMQRGAEYGVRGTPAFFINGRVVMGAQPLEAFENTIDAALQDAAGD